ncbi:hypothetical protein ACFXP3_14120 [Streptomyces sp. NPDC059096]|uniref:hypothetical protein n=1 Tax=Streptomyces sp. NPDC059096 TaxID=3346727 RepID=UPI0036A8AB04
MAVKLRVRKGIALPDKRDLSDGSPPDHYTDVHHHAGRAVDSEWALSLAAGMAVAPFLSAIASHFGSLLAGEIDEHSRIWVRRFLRREVEERRHRASVRDEFVRLNTRDGWHVRIWEGIPAEALAQLAALCAAEPPVEQVEEGAIFWLDNCWCGMAYVDGSVTPYMWDAEANCWVRR